MAERAESLDLSRRNKKGNQRYKIKAKQVSQTHLLAIPFFLRKSEPTALISAQLLMKLTIEGRISSGRVSNEAGCFSELIARKF